MYKDKEGRPIFVTTDKKPKCTCEENKKDINCQYCTSRLYLMDMDNMEIPVCDCIRYDRNGNPKCSLHKGKLQEFFLPGDILFIHDRTKQHIDNDGKPLCNHRIVKGNEWIKAKGYVTCKNCLGNELVARRRVIEAHKLINEESWFMEPFDPKDFKAKGELKDLK